MKGAILGVFVIFAALYAANASVAVSPPSTHPGNLHATLSAHSQRFLLENIVLHS